MKRTLQIRRVLFILSIYFALIDSYFFTYLFILFILNVHVLRPSFPGWPYLLVTFT